MGLQVKSAGEQDAARSVVIEKVAYGRGSISDIIFPGPASEDADGAREAQMLKSLREDPASCLWLQVVDEDRVGTGQHGMVCFSMGYLWLSTPPPPTTTTRRVWGPGSNPEACERFFGGMTSKWAERMGNKPHFYLKLLHTDPTYQRRGAASMLLKRWAERADEHGLESYLEATEEGRPLYEKFGYETVDVLVTDFSKWGGPDKFETCLMLRKPKTGSA
ncbi:acetyltransferase, GNAT family [Cordyceps fumosorosea ARSEF 2679]|uniref:Acetyltransferase, GNAT family n=1 Tax=Cordyceps fumosorosea (strain ARSEF 2679) TaxID=1081104 RepID=A0A168AQZ5_CORFA|nr:acetyltransferase, GNAT family [Cordyceps fumosorosea ARSEF 2679]OAA69076.1 acetyltransferase, GNAT family [Cordyceps fumosorosea ARSEF 2679]